LIKDLRSVGSKKTFLPLEAIQIVLLFGGNRQGLKVSASTFIHTMAEMTVFSMQQLWNLVGR
jgi:hypothetical protein